MKKTIVGIVVMLLFGLVVVGHADDKRGDSSQQIKQMTILTPTQIQALKKFLALKMANLLSKALDFSQWNKTCKGYIEDCVIETMSKKQSSDVLENDVCKCISSKNADCKGYSICAGKEKQLEEISLSSTKPNGQKFNYDVYCEEENNGFHVAAKCTEDCDTTGKIKYDTKTSPITNVCVNGDVYVFDLSPVLLTPSDPWGSVVCCIGDGLCLYSSGSMNIGEKIETGVAGFKFVITSLSIEGGKCVIEYATYCK